MQLESHATPSQETPEQRYATLHRAIERGMASDEIWKELAEVSLRLGHSDEAVRCAQRIEGETVRGLLESRLRRLGLLPPITKVDPPVAPAASNAGTRAISEEREESPSLLDHLVDAFQYLFHQHMPWLVLMTTLAFPLVIGVGGFLTAGQSPWMLAAIAALPGLCVLSVVGAMGRQILLASSEGNGDVPPIPGFADLVDDARRFVLDSILVFSSLIAPSLIAMLLGAPRSTTLPGLVIGALLAPLMWTLRQLRGDLRSLSPTTMLRALARAGVGYFGLALATCLMFAPAVAIGWTILERPVWVQISAVGPLCVVPIFVASRLFGTWVDSRRTRLSSILLLTRKKAPVVSSAIEPVSRPRFPQRPESLKNFRAPVAHRPAPKVGPTPGATPTAARTAAAPAATNPSPIRAATKKQPAASPVAAKQPAAGPVAAKKPTAARAAAPAPTAAAPAKPEKRSIQGRGPRRNPAEGPDLANMPGAVVLSGTERDRLAAAKKP